ncbi:MAG TPA: hypothetical protein VKR58_10500, partial [Aquella sp.]|nr:hypothetical protein [Aquella sp.]
FGKPGNPDAEASEIILSEISENYEELKRVRNIIQEFKARIGNGAGSQYLVAYDRTVLQKYLDIYEKNDKLKKCAQTLNLKDCGSLQADIEAKKEKKKTEGGNDFLIADARGSEMLDFIRDNNYTVRLLTLKNATEDTPKFEGTSCNLQPSYTPDAPNTLILSCPKTSSLAEVTELPYEGIRIKVGSDRKLSFDGFVYAVVEGKEKYCFKYPGGVLPQSSPGVYVYKDPQIKYHHQIKLTDEKGRAKPCPDATDISAWTNVTDSNVTQLSRRFTFVQDSLVTVYPNIIY